MAAELTVRDRDNVRWIELDRPLSKNGLTVAVNRAIAEALHGVAQESSLRAVVITGARGNFCSGLDLREGLGQVALSPEAIQEHIRNSFQGLIRALRAVEAPVIAAIDGDAVGFGCDLALACDIRLISERARLGEVFVRRGLMPDGGATFLLPRLVGLGRAMDLLLTGAIIDASEALRLGLASRLYPTDQFRSEVTAYAASLAKGPTLAFREIKRAVYASLEGDFTAGLEREAQGQLRCLQSRDFSEGIAAFFAKRPPDFTGR